MSASNPQEAAAIERVASAPRSDDVYNPVNEYDPIGESGQRTSSVSAPSSCSSSRRQVRRRRAPVHLLTSPRSPASAPWHSCPTLLVSLLFARCC